MSISKKIRFEVFKRDGFQCAYCGTSPPTATLEVDHIEPRSKKGQDDINNLITACFDCNRGKSNISLRKIPLQLSDNLEALKEKEAQIKEYRTFIKKIERREKKDIQEITIAFEDYFGGQTFTEEFKSLSLKRFLKFLPKHEIIEALHIAIQNYPRPPDRCIRYFCGICWRKIREKNGE